MPPENPSETIGQPSGVIALLSDFGASSPYVAAMKGVIHSIHRQATIVDITHAIPAQDLRQGAWVLAEVARHFPAGTGFVAVVDPGVGSERGIVYACIAGRHFIAPDNGLLSRLAQESPPAKIVRLTEPEHWLPRVSATFHGRDIMAPVAARLSLGLDPDRLGTPQRSLVELEWPEIEVSPFGIRGSIRFVDSFGNLISDIPAKALSAAPDPQAMCVRCEGHEIRGLSRTYSDHPASTLVALIGSSGYLELAVVGKSAALLLGATVGTQVMVSW